MTALLSAWQCLACSREARSVLSQRLQAVGVAPAVPSQPPPSGGGGFF